MTAEWIAENFNGPCGYDCKAKVEYPCPTCVLEGLIESAVDAARVEGRREGLVLAVASVQTNRADGETDLRCVIARIEQIQQEGGSDGE